MATPAKPTDDTTADGTTASPAGEGQDAVVHTDTSATTGATLSTDLLRGAVGGLVAGAVFMGLAAWFSAADGGTPFDAFRAVAALVLGGEPAELGREALALGAAIHVGFALLAGVVFAFAAPLLRRHDALVSVAVAYGGLLYVVNLLVFGQEAYPLFEDGNPALDLGAHLLFGALLGATFAGIRLPGEAARDILGQRVARAVGALSAAVVAFLHLALADQFLGDDRYVGAVVVAVAVAMACVAVQLARRADLVAWVVGVLASVGVITVYVLARTTGLPTLDDTGGAPGLAAVVAAGVFLLAFVGAMVGRRRRRTEVRRVPRTRPTRADMSAKDATVKR